MKTDRIDEILRDRSRLQHQMVTLRLLRADHPLVMDLQAEINRIERRLELIISLHWSMYFKKTISQLITQ